MNTPWGQSDHQRTIGEGIIFYGTPSHGGAKVQHEQNLLIPPALRNKDGWYEEDCEIEKLCFVFPHLFPDNDQDRTIAYLKNYIPDEFEEATGTIIPMEESHLKQERKFYADNIDNYLVFSAVGCGSHDKTIPEGFVKCSAAKGIDFTGKYHNWNGKTEKVFFVPDAEYGDRKFCFVIDPTRHVEVLATTRAS